MLKAPSNEYELARAGMEYKLALQAIRKVVRNGKGTAYEQVTEIQNIVRSMEEDLKKRSGKDDNGGEGGVAEEPAG
jgi:hypothetical protein